MDFSEQWKSLWSVSSVFPAPLFLSSSFSITGPLRFRPSRSPPMLLFASPSLTPPLPLSLHPSLVRCFLHCLLKSNKTDFLPSSLTNSLSLPPQPQPDAPPISRILIKNLIKNQQTLDSLMAHMRILFGEEVAKPPFVAPEAMHIRDEIFTPKYQGWSKRTWADVQYKGDWMRRPISDGEVAWLARLLINLSVWLNSLLGLDKAENISADSVYVYPDLPGYDTEYVGGLKDALWMVLSSLCLWSVFMGQVVLRFLREYGLRINLRVFASKKLVMFLISFAIFSLWRKACGLSFHPSAIWVSLVP